MPVTDLHPEYVKWQPIWTRCRDAAAGGDAIRARCLEHSTASPQRVQATPDSPYTRYRFADSSYVPRLLGEADERYWKRLHLGLWYDATERTLGAWKGTMFRKPGTTTVLPSMEPHRDNIDLAGTPYEVFKQNLGKEVCTVGRVGVLQDWSEVLARPYWLTYTTEQIINWSYRTTNYGQRVVDQIVLAENLQQRREDGFGSEEVEQYRVVELDDQGVYFVRVYAVTEQGGLPELVEERQPQRQGVTLLEIPFECIGPFGLDLCPSKPPVLGVADVNVDHYRLDIDHKLALHVNAIATLFVFGEEDPDKGVYELGPYVHHKLPAAGRAEFVSGGAATEPVKLEKQADEERMALLGARLLSKPKREAETAEALQILQTGEDATLTSIAQMESEGLTRLWKRHALWLGEPSTEVGEKLNTDFNPAQLSADRINALFALVVSNKLSLETFLQILFEGEVIPHDAETELGKIAEELVSMPEAPATDTGMNAAVPGEDARTVDANRAA